MSRSAGQLCLFCYFVSKLCPDPPDNTVCSANEVSKFCPYPPDNSACSVTEISKLCPDPPDSPACSATDVSKFCPDPPATRRRQQANTLQCFDLHTDAFRTSMAQRRSCNAAVWIGVTPAGICYQTLRNNAMYLTRLHFWMTIITRIGWGWWRGGAEKVIGDWK
jgi:hypothetical protein